MILGSVIKWLRHGMRLAPASLEHMRCPVWQRLRQAAALVAGVAGELAGGAGDVAGPEAGRVAA